METKNEQKNLTSAIKYAFALRLGAPYSPTDVPTIGIVFGNPQLATICHQSICESYDDDQLTIDITPGVVTAGVNLKEVSAGKIIFSVELNYDGAELLRFEHITPADSRVALIFGFKHGCDYYVTGNSKDKAEDFSPIVLSGFNIIE